MTNDSTELPIFPATGPAVFHDPEASTKLYTEVLGGLADVIDVPTDLLDNPTPCAGFTVSELRSHTLGWLQFFAAALLDPLAESPRPEADGFTLAADDQGGKIVVEALHDISRAIAQGVAEQTVTMMAARMAGHAVLAMALGEYIIHAWDLATATGQPYSVSDAAVSAAHEFLLATVAPEYRGPDSGFYDQEFAVPADASPLHQLLGFAGRNPQWTASDADVG